MSEFYDDEDDNRPRSLSNMQVLGFMASHWMAEPRKFAAIIGLGLLATVCDLSIPWATSGLINAVSAPEKAGLDALRVVHPADAKEGGEKLSLTAVAFPKDSGMTDPELLDYVASTFLGASGPGKPVERTILGKTAKGRAFEKKIPSPSLAEVFVATKKEGGKVVLAFVFSPSVAKEAEAAVAAIAESLKE